MKTNPFLEICREPGHELLVLRDGVLADGEVHEEAGFRLTHRGTADRFTATCEVKGEGEGTLQFFWGIEVDGWHEGIHLHLPAGAYQGNRFRSLALPYSPRLPAELLGDGSGGYITDVPRLRADEGPSRLELLSRDLAYPLLALWDPKEGRALAIRSQTAESALIFTVEENEARDGATLRVGTPGVRNTPVYRMNTTTFPSPDAGAPWAKGTVMGLALIVESWPCHDAASFHDRLFDLRRSFTQTPRIRSEIPFSHGAQLIEEHYHRDNWHEGAGMFATDPRLDSRFWFQTGWCGGMMGTLPLLAHGSPQGRTRSKRNLQVFFEHAPMANGLFRGKALADGRWMNDFGNDEARPHTHTWTLVRRQADALYFLLRQVELLKERGETVPESWTRALQAAADFWVAHFNTNSRIGHFLDAETGAILIEGSSSGGLLPAALLTAARVLARPDLTEMAVKIGRFYASGELAHGYTTGGPGDALQNPDSESVAALVESFALLAEAGFGDEFLSAGRAAAALLSSWVMPYDFPFPAGSEFGRLGLPSAGSVFANTQNKHSAPGLCTHSGLGLFRLWRRTEDLRLFELGSSIARALPFYISRPDRPIHAPDGRPLPSGWMNERVNTSDWDHNMGGVFYGSTWAEVSMLLTWADWPGVVVRTDLARVWATDHVEAALEGRTLRLSNTTAYPAEVSLWVDDRDSLARPVTDKALRGMKRIRLLPGQTRYEEVLSPSA